MSVGFLKFFAGSVGRPTKRWQIRPVRYGSRQIQADVWRLLGGRGTVPSDASETNPGCFFGDDGSFSALDSRYFPGPSEQMSVRWP